VFFILVGSGALEKEEEFVQKCMESLSAASSQLDQVVILLNIFAPYSKYVCVYVFEARPLYCFCTYVDVNGSDLRRLKAEAKDFPNTE